MRNNYIKNNYKSITNIEEFLKNEPIEEKYIRFFNVFYFISSSKRKINNEIVDIIGLGAFVDSGDKNAYGMMAMDRLLNEICDLRYDWRYELLYNGVLQEIEEYKKIDIEDFDDDEAVIYYYGQSLEKYLNTFEIDSNEKLLRTLNQQINSYLNYLGLSIMDL